MNLAFANSNVSEIQTGSQEPGQEGRRKAEQGMMRPDGEVSTSQQQDRQGQSEFRQDRVESKSPSSVENEVDSVEDDSVSKYNFIFYFLYKFKYDNEEAP
ncbi:hypothetical protein SAMN05421640_1612 [Ekhidna lutea]|uniref:Uncharacterized protein n=1 Tax=Ekhidna lutea TaxID=447679 RepID=A0A239IDC9_EKHLU|nr:hypothetical protein [Ekhidna lutea]SNS91529.1 hypothetical protein SAMN05421640_1612 [Ekhidna lutea]